MSSGARGIRCANPAEVALTPWSVVKSAQVRDPGAAVVCVRRSVWRPPPPPPPPARGVGLGEFLGGALGRPGRGIGPFFAIPAPAGFRPPGARFAMCIATTLTEAADLSARYT